MEITRDSICRGELWLKQPRRGYRFNVDSVIMAHLCGEVIRPEIINVVDLCAGCGVIGLLLAKRFGHLQLKLVELQHELAQLAAENIVDNQLSQQATLIQSDLRDVEKWSNPSPQLIVANPPFFPVGQGKASPNPQIAQAKHEISCSLKQLIDAAALASLPGSNFCLIFPALREKELLERLFECGYKCIARRPIYPLPDQAPTRIWIWASLDQLANHLLPESRTPLIIEDEPDKYSEEMDFILRDCLAK